MILQHTKTLCALNCDTECDELRVFTVLYSPNSSPEKNLWSESMS